MHGDAVSAHAAVAGPLVDATRKYKLMLATCITLALPFMVLTAIASQRPNRLGVLYICASLLGLLALPVLPVALDMSAEITYPIPAGLTSTILWFCSQVSSAASLPPCRHTMSWPGEIMVCMSSGSAWCVQGG